MRIFIELAKAADVRLSAKANQIAVKLLPSVPFESIHLLPICEAVYFFLNERNKILYVGLSRRLVLRFRSHQALALALGKSVKRVAWLPLGALGTWRECQNIESDLIKHFSPPLNKAPSVVATLGKRQRLGRIRAVKWAERLGVSKSWAPARLRKTAYGMENE